MPNHFSRRSFGDAIADEAIIANRNSAEFWFNIAGNNGRKIAALEAENANLKEALKPFANAFPARTAGYDPVCVTLNLDMDDFDRARAALAKDADHG